MATVSQFLLDGGHEKFEEAVKLNDIESKNDPENEPYKSKYRAREIYTDLKSKLESLRQDGAFDSREADICQIMTAGLELLLGANYAETEELSTGEEHLSRCVKSIEPLRLDPRACNILHNALNQMGILWTARRQPDKALEFLKQAEALYLDYTKEVGNAPEIVGEQFKKQSENEDIGIRDRKRSENFESTYTHSLYYLAQVHAKLGDNKKSAEYCHVTLRRQLETKTYSPVDWALNCATLSQYYITKGDFHYARHCLASSTLILRESGDPPESLTVQPMGDEDQASLESREQLPKTWADLYRCAVKYALALFEASMNRLLDEEEEKAEVPSTETPETPSGEKAADHNSDLTEGKEGQSTDGNHDKDTGPGQSAESKHENQTEPEKEESKLYFNLELTAIENQVTDKFILTFDQAREVFLVAQKWLNSAREFYLLDGHCTDHVEIVQDHSKLYKLLAFFEMDFDRQAKMHKRRADMLDSLQGQLSMQHYLLVCRQLLFELGETYSAMLDIKLAIIESNGEPPNARSMKKINQLARQSIEKYLKYIDTLRGADKQLPDKYSDDDERPALVAHFCVGRLHTKYIQFDPKLRIADIKNALCYYQHLVDYVKRNPEARPVVGPEVEICEELVDLLPKKMEKIRAESEIV